MADGGKKGDMNNARGEWPRKSIQVHSPKTLFYQLCLAKRGGEGYRWSERGENKDSDRFRKGERKDEIEMEERSDFGGRSRLGKE